MFTQWIAEHGTDADRRALTALQDVPAESTRLRAVFESSGALAYGRTRCKTLLDEATQLASTAPVETPFRQAFCDMVTFIRGRNA
jgi:geranylgeranyl pyrophosphate synthase